MAAIIHDRVHITNYTYKSDYTFQSEVLKNSPCRVIRLKIGLSAKELAKKCHVHPQTITNIERGHTKNSIITLRKIAKVLKTPIRIIGAFDKMPEDTIGQKILKARCIRGLTVREASHMLGIYFETYLDYENDRHIVLEKYQGRIEEFISIIKKEPGKKPVPVRKLIR